MKKRKTMKSAATEEANATKQHIEDVRKDAGEHMRTPVVDQRAGVECAGGHGQVVADSKEQQSDAALTSDAGAPGLTVQFPDTSDLILREARVQPSALTSDT